MSLEPDPLQTLPVEGGAVRLRARSRSRRLARPWLTRLPQFCREEAGTVTTEFVIIFPVVMALFFLIAFVSMLISAASDVQQLAHELARAAFPLAAHKTPGSDICATLRNEVLPGLLQASLLVNPGKLTLLPCPTAPTSTGYITIQVSYNFAGDFVANLGRSFGISLGVVNRTSTTHL